MLGVLRTSKDERCPRCGDPVAFLEMRDGTTITVDPFPALDVIVFSAKDHKGVPASICYFRHDAVCALARRRKHNERTGK